MSELKSIAANQIYEEIRQLPDFPIDDEDAWKATAAAIADSGLTMEDVANLAVDTATADVSLLSFVLDSGKRDRFIKALQLTRDMQQITADGKGASMANTVQLTAKQTLEYFARVGRGEEGTCKEQLLRCASNGSQLAQACASYVLVVASKEENQALAKVYFDKSMPWIRSQALCGNFYAMTFLGFHYAYTKCLHEEDKRLLYESLMEVVQFGVHSSQNGFLKTAREGATEAASAVATKAVNDFMGLFKTK